MKACAAVLVAELTKRRLMPSLLMCQLRVKTVRFIRFTGFGHSGGDRSTGALATRGTVIVEILAGSAKVSGTFVCMSSR